MIGPNGAGKSTLLKIIAGLESEDAGTLSFKRDLRVGYVPQSNDFSEASPLQILIDAAQVEHDKERCAQTILSKLGFTGEEKSAATLSGGWKKRLAIGRALLNDPDVLLLDEPTNHLDLEGVLWLETFLNREVETFIVVSHDRTFLQSLTTRIMEIDRVYPEGLLAITGPFEHFLEKKRLFLEGQLEQERAIASKARHEASWLARSPQARTTKSQSRVDAAKELLKEHGEIKKRNAIQTAKIAFDASERETRKLLTVHHLSYQVEGRTLFSHLDMTLLRGTRLALLGENGSGKTTLLRLLAGELLPQQGTIKRADDLKIVYFDQERAKLPLTLTLKEALAPQGDYVFFQGRPIHINGWCKRFLFSPDTLTMPIGKLSGGERARIAIAHLMLQPADLLLLDEPANDLDIPTLQTLEESLLTFPGALVLITHDRYMLSRLCNLSLSLSSSKPPQEPPQKKRNDAKKIPPPPRKKLSYQQQREYEQMEPLIAKAEQNLAHLHTLLSHAPPEKLQELCLAIAAEQAHIDILYTRFAELDALNFIKEK